MLGLSDDVLAAGTISISTVLLCAGDTRISGWVQSISTAADCEDNDEIGLLGKKVRSEQKNFKD